MPCVIRKDKWTPNFWCLFVIYPDREIYAGCASTKIGAESYARRLGFTVVESPDPA
jgi:hypothetical protein